MLRCRGVQGPRQRCAVPPARCLAAVIITPSASFSFPATDVDTAPIRQPWPGVVFVSDPRWWVGLMGARRDRADTDERNDTRKVRYGLRMRTLACSGVHLFYANRSTASTATKVGRVRIPGLAAQRAAGAAMMRSCSDCALRSSSRIPYPSPPPPLLLLLFLLQRSQPPVIPTRPHPLAAAQPRPSRAREFFFPSGSAHRSFHPPFAICPVAPLGPTIEKVPRTGESRRTGGSREGWDGQVGKNGNARHGVST
ncbi:hypothetical protein CSOJ01_03107 [Colletotrichum sojae]|uniref:Uncharacterized protein n=1 Tax=Colletotrichum sojae TaxID=2175907 RepID=A0A8H6N1N2_9PEZI|nr:hypothetical protein CSOJ01_03107 [Colletotrichum sojae]